VVPLEASLGHNSPAIKFTGRDFEFTIDLIAMKRHIWARVRLVVNCSLPIAIFLVGLPVVCVGQSPQSARAAKTDPAAYLNQAIDIMQTKALRRNTVDWARTRAAALAMAAHAESTVGTYDAIRFALASLGDHHSSLHLTPTLEALEAEEKTKHPSPNPLLAKPENFSPYVGRYKPEGHLEQRGNKSFAYVVLTKCFPENDRDFVAFETDLQKIVAGLGSSHPSGWVIDLRGNVGGNMWPMLAGIGPVLGEGENLGEFFNISGHSVWRYRDGVAAEVDNGKVIAYPSVEGGAYHLAGMPDVAVLIDHSTSSSGEAIAIAFRGRPNTRFFGEHTQGSSTVNQTFPLTDGASMWLTVGIQADRNGKQYIDGLAPDEVFPAATESMRTSTDPVVLAALNWLSRNAESSKTGK
jgi:carboxyl-terminal processing protease